MPWKLRAYHCEDCGRWTERKRVSNEPKVCVDCGRERMRHLNRKVRPDTPVSYPPDELAE